LQRHSLRPGDVCLLRLPSAATAPAIAWAASGKMQDQVIQTSRPFQELHGLRLGTEVMLEKSPDPVLDAESVVLSEVANNVQSKAPEKLLPEDYAHWEWCLSPALSKARLLSQGMMFANIGARGEERSFKIVDINPSPTTGTLYRFEPKKTKIRLRGTSGIAPSRLNMIKDGVAGLRPQLDDLNFCLAEYGNALEGVKSSIQRPPRRGGLLLYGPPGTGKSLLLRKISEAGWERVINVPLESSPTALQKLIDEAARFQPSVLIIDGLEKMAPNQGNSTDPRSFAIITTFNQAFDALQGSRVLS
jgi:AAA family ATPase